MVTSTVSKFQNRNTSLKLYGYNKILGTGTMSGTLLGRTWFLARLTSSFSFWAPFACSFASSRPIFGMLQQWATTVAAEA
jgi:hypothetical protein